MDYHLKQWRNQHQSEPPASAKIPRLVEPDHPPSGPALPLFVPEPNSSSRINNLSAIPDSASTRFPMLGGFFSLAQWQELELQALIFKYLLAGAAVPAELLQPIKKSFLNIPACYLHHHPQYQHYQPAMLQSGYWGRGVVDPEPGRCRRTDGKKWRCSRDVVAGQKYCERHMHRGRNRSRKPVEIPTPTSTGGGLKTTIPIAASPITAVANGTHFTLSGSSPSVNLFHLNQRSSEFKTGDGSVVETHHEKVSSEDGQDGQILRHFFDDWPRSNHEPNAGGTNASPENSTTSLSISIQGNASSDFSLKLSTGNGDGTGAREANTDGREQPQQLNWAAGWGTHPVASMGGPLAEALRSSTSNSSSSPTSVLHERQRGSASDSVST